MACPTADKGALMIQAALDFLRFVLGKLRLKPQQAVILGLIALLVIGGACVWGVIYIIRNDPVLLTAKYPYISPSFPSEGLEQLIPQQRDNKVVVLFQRIVWDLDHWAFTDDTSSCAPKVGERTSCDEVHAYGSWTLIVPSSGVKLSGSSGASSGTIGDIVPLTPHTIHADPPIDGIQDWYVTTYIAPPGQVEVVIMRRDFFGGFQPLAQDKRKYYDTPTNTCEGNSVGIAVRNPTARAELIFHTPPEMPIRTDEFHIWRRSATRSVEEIRAHDRFGNIHLQEHNIHWSMGTPLLRDADREDTTYLMSWRWARPITTGPICGSRRGAR
jgi:hypothetical protein